MYSYKPAKFRTAQYQLRILFITRRLNWTTLHYIALHHVTYALHLHRTYIAHALQKANLKLNCIAKPTKLLGRTKQLGKTILLDRTHWTERNCWAQTNRINRK